MYAPERQQEILRIAGESGRVDVLSLAEQFQVTAETVRRDLKALDRAGLLRRVHGGAIPAGRLGFEPDLAERDTVAPTRRTASPRPPWLSCRPRATSSSTPARPSQARRRRPPGLDPHRGHPRPAGRRPPLRPPGDRAAPGRRPGPSPYARGRRRLGAARVRRDQRGRRLPRHERLLRRRRPDHPRPRRGRREACRVRRPAGWCSSPTRPSTARSTSPASAISPTSTC